MSAEKSCSLSVIGEDVAKQIEPELELVAANVACAFWRDEAIRLTAERDTALTQNAEPEKRIAQFIESISQLSNQVVELQNARDGLERANAELVTQVAGRDALLNNLSKWIEQLPVPTKPATSWLMRIDGVMKESPNQHLRQIQADAGRAGFVAGYVKCWHDCHGTEAPEHVVPYLSNQYAAKVRQGGE